MEHTKHLWRVGIILVALMVMAVTGRTFLIPKSFGETGHFRHDSIYEYMAKPVMHGNDHVCAKCHKDEYKTKMAGKHQAVPCETCHSALMTHVDEKLEGKTADMLTNPTYELCALCHQKLAARPAAQPQVDLRQHLIDKDVPIKGKIPAKVCKTCHAPHDPLSE